MMGGFGMRFSVFQVFKPFFGILKIRTVQLQREEQIKSRLSLFKETHYRKCAPKG